MKCGIKNIDTSVDVVKATYLYSVLLSLLLQMILWWIWVQLKKTDANRQNKSKLGKHLHRFDSTCTAFRKHTANTENTIKYTNMMEGAQMKQKLFPKDTKSDEHGLDKHVVAMVCHSSYWVRFAYHWFMFIIYYVNVVNFWISFTMHIHLRWLHTPPGPCRVK